MKPEMFALQVIEKRRTMRQKHIQLLSLKDSQEELSQTPFRIDRPRPPQPVTKLVRGTSDELIDRFTGAYSIDALQPDKR